MGQSGESIDPVELQTLGADGYERKYVHEVYDRIADHFSSTRYKGWPNVVSFVEREARRAAKESGSAAIIVDVGCGNGKYCASPKYDEYPAIWIGADFSRNLLQQAREITKPPVRLRSVSETRELTATTTSSVKRKSEEDRRQEEKKPVFLKGGSNLMPVEVGRVDALHLPHRSGIADVCICIAMLHHLSSPERRRQALCELARVTKTGGGILVYVWAAEQKKASIGARDFNGKTQLLVPWKTPKPNSASSNSSGEAPPEAPSQTSSELRFYEIFTESRAVAECQDIPGTVLESHSYDSNNWAIVLRKVGT